MGEWPKDCRHQRTKINYIITVEESWDHPLRVNSWNIAKVDSYDESKLKYPNFPII